MKAITLQDTDERLVQVFRALGHPARLRIIRILMQRQTCICSDVVEELPLAQSTVSQHLKVLRDAGIIEGTVEGPAVCYCLAPGALDALQKAIADLATDANEHTTCCP